MNTFSAEVKLRKLIPWTAAYLAAAWAALQVMEFLSDTYGWPSAILRAAPIMAAGGLLLVIVLAWFHGAGGRQRVRPLELLLISVVTMGTGSIALVFAAGGGEDRRVERDVASKSVAVLPFVNMSSESEQEYFSDGLTEELLNALAQVPTLRVAARTSSFAFKDKNVPVAEVARTLNVATVLEGSVRKAGSRVRITAQLINAEDGYHLWSQSYDRELTDIFAIQEEIARSITSALRVRLGAADSAVLVRETHDLDAYNLYLQARFLWNRRTQSDNARAQELLKEAVRKDPQFARAYAALADVYLIAADYGLMHAAAALDSTELYARKALALDSTLSEPYAALGGASADRHQWQQALTNFNKAIALNPNNVSAYHWRAGVLQELRQLTQAEASVRQALRLDPLSGIANIRLGSILLAQGRAQEAVAQYRHSVALDTTFTIALNELALAYAVVGDTAQALRTLERTMQVRRQRTRFELAAQAYVHARAGHVREAREIVREMHEKGYWASTVGTLVALGDQEAALAAAERAVETGDPTANSLYVEPTAAPIREHPRFRAVLRQLNLAE